MDLRKFKDIEVKYLELREKADRSEIDNATLNKELRKLMVIDQKGSYWIIGGNSGKWYRYDGKDWEKDTPYKSEEQQEKEIYNTNKIIKSEVKKESHDDAHPSSNKKPDFQNVIPELLVYQLNIVSLIFFLGGIGIIIGIIAGATIGIFKDIPVFIDLPQILVNLRSNLLGGILYAILGGIIGFIFFAVKAVFLGSLYNMISYFFGGIRFKTKK